MPAANFSVALALLTGHNDVIDQLCVCVLTDIERAVKHGDCPRILAVTSSVALHPRFFLGRLTLKTADDLSPPKRSETDFRKSRDAKNKTLIIVAYS